MGRGMKIILPLSVSATPFGLSIARMASNGFFRATLWDQWRGVAFCRRRDTLIREAKKLHVSEALLSLPEHHDGLSDDAPRWGVCGRLRSRPTGVLPRHLFCHADRRT